MEVVAETRPSTCAQAWRSPRRSRRPSAACSTPCAGGVRRRSPTSPRRSDMTPSGARQHLAALADAGLLRPASRPRPPASRVGPSRCTASPRPPSRCSRGLRRADQPAARLRARRRRDGGVRAPPRRPHRGRPAPGSAPSAAFRAKVTELARILDEDGYLASVEPIGRDAYRDRRAQLRHLRRRPRAPPGLLDGARVPAGRAARGADRPGDAHDGRAPTRAATRSARRP